MSADDLTPPHWGSDEPAGYVSPFGKRDGLFAVVTQRLADLRDTD